MDQMLDLLARNQSVARAAGVDLADVPAEEDTEAQTRTIIFRIGRLLDDGSGVGFTWRSNLWRTAGRAENGRGCEYERTHDEILRLDPDGCGICRVQI